MLFPMVSCLCTSPRSSPKSSLSDQRSTRLATGPVDVHASASYLTAASQLNRDKSMIWCLYKQLIGRSLSRVVRRAYMILNRQAPTVRAVVRSWGTTLSASWSTPKQTPCVSRRYLLCVFSDFVFRLPSALHRGGIWWEMQPDHREVRARASLPWLRA